MLSMSSWSCTISSRSITCLFFLHLICFFCCFFQLKNDLFFHYCCCCCCCGEIFGINSTLYHPFPDRPIYPETGSNETLAHYLPPRHLIDEFNTVFIIYYFRPYLCYIDNNCKELSSLNCSDIMLSDQLAVYCSTTALKLL